MFIQTYDHGHPCFFYIRDTKNVKQSRYRPGVAQRVPGKDSEIS